MRVRVRKSDLDGAPKPVSSWCPSPVQLSITVGKEYEVMALIQSGELAMLQIVGDEDFPEWLPSWFFDVVDSTIPADWICNTAGDERWIAIGPEFVVKDHESYEQMVLREPASVARFWARVERIEAERQAAARLVEILRKIAAELEPFSQGLSTDSGGSGKPEARPASEAPGQSARAAARWRDKAATIALTLEAQKSGLRPEQRATLSRTFFDAADSLVSFSLSEQEFPDASQTNVRLLELVAALYEAME